MIDPTIIQSEDIEVCTKGLISFAHQGDKQNFVHLLCNNTAKREEALQLLGWPKNLSIEGHIDAYKGILSLAKIRDWKSCFNNKIACEIICNSVDPNSLKNKKKELALTWAYKQKKIDIIKLLLNIEKIDPNIRDENDQTILYIIVSSYFPSRKDVKIAKLLLSHKKINPNATPEHRTTVDMICNKISFSTEELKIIKLLFNNEKFDPNEKKNGRTILYTLCSDSFFIKNYTDVIELLLRNKKLDINTVNDEKQTILHKLCASYLNINKMNLIKLLIENGANPNKENKNGYTVLDIACQQDIIKEAQELLLKNNAHHSWKYYYEKSNIQNIVLTSAAIGLGVCFYSIIKK